MKRLLLILLSIIVLAFGFSYAYNTWVKKDATGDVKALAEGGEFVNVDGVEYYVNISGLGGKTFLMLHDWGDSSATWKEVTETVSKQHTVISVDLAGFGYSEKSADINYRLEARSEQLAKLLDIIGFKEVTVVGSGYGGTVGLALAKDYPSKVKSVILIGPTVLQKKLKFPSFIYKIPQISKAGIKLANSDKRLEAQLQKSIFNPNNITSIRLQSYVKPYTLKGIEDANLAMASQKDSKKYVHTQIGAIPILILWGEKDTIVSRADMERLRADMLDVTLISVPEAGHFVQDDNPELVSSRIMGFGK